MIRHTRHTDRGRRPGYVIFAVLIVVVVLALVAYRFTDSMTAEYKVGARANDAAQAKAAAVSGLHYAAAVLSDRATFVSELDSDPFDNPDIFARVEVPAVGGSTARKKAYFDIRSVARLDGGGYEPRFGVIDEGGKLNINSLIALDKKGTALYNALVKIPNMSPEIADAIVDWVDADDTKRPNGAESSEYSSLPNPYKAKNGPLNSLDELLLVQGVTPELLYGGDRNRNGVLDEGESGADCGWSDFLTVYGRELNVDANGDVRILLNPDDPNTIAQQLTTALGDEMATYILAYKLLGGKATDANGELPPTTPATAPKPTKDADLSDLKAAVDAKLKAASSLSPGKKVASLMDLVYSRVTLPRAQGAPADAPELVYKSPLLGSGRAELLPLLLDKTTTTKDVELKPRVNVNSAPREVLLALTGVTVSETKPGTREKIDVPILTEDDVDAILIAREGRDTSGPAPNTIAWLVTGANIAPTSIPRMEKYITGNSMVYRVQSVGYLEGTGGPVARMEAVIDTNRGAPRFLLVRDLTDLENPRGFDGSKPLNP